jgi:hypothetical protein
MSGDDGQRSRGGWARELLREVFADQPGIPPGRYCAYNAFVGLILVAFAVVLWVDPRPGRDSPADVGFIGVVGVILLSGIAVALWRPAATSWLLAVHGALIVLLTLWLLGTGIRAALTSPLTSFRYLPGPVLIGMSYGMLQVAQFGPWRRQSKGLRRAGFVAGIAGEVAFAACVALHYFNMMGLPRHIATMPNPLKIDTGITVGFGLSSTIGRLTLRTTGPFTE